MWFDRRLILNFDFFLLLAVLFLCGMSVVNLKSICASSNASNPVFFYKQLYWIFIGLGIVFLIININYITLVKYAYYIHSISLFLLIIVLFYGTTKFGSQRWINIAGFSLQPSEIAKLTFLLVLARFFSENIPQKAYALKDLLIPFLFLAITFIPIYMQPDLGTAGIMVILFFSIIFFVHIRKKTLYFFSGIILLFLPFSWFILKDYQKDRILIFLNPELDPLNSGYQLIQSKIAVGSGGLIGRGFKMGTQSQLRFLPEQHTDFVFSVWAEEWGFIGCVVLLFIIFFIIYRGLSIAYSCKNFYGSFLAVGISFLFFWQFIINVFMTIGLFPVVGVPFPFFSYGGSALLTNMIGIALLLNINMRKFK